MSVADNLVSTYDTLTTQITEALGLQPTDFTASYDADYWSISPSSDTTLSGTSLWLSESSPRYLTGVSFCTSKATSPQQEESSYTINIWMGPSYDLPHMLLTFGQSTDFVSSTTTYSIKADYITRGATPFGSDPQMVENYYGPDVIQAWTTAYSLPGVSPLTPQAEFSSRILNSPAFIAVHQVTSLPEVNALIQDHVYRFLSWVNTAQPIMARARGSFNMRDDKLRQFYFKGEVGKNILRLGENLGVKVASANTGPVAEAYVGGGS